MSQPPAYNRAFNFQDYEASHPTATKPGDELDEEFSRVKLTLDAILSNLALIQRDDTALGNDTVGFDQLKAEVSIGVNAPTTWTTATAYIVNDTVFNSQKFYRCLVSHTSGTFATDLAAGKWTLIADFTMVQSAAGISYDNTTSGLAATTVQTAVDEISAAQATAATKPTVRVKTTGNITLSGTQTIDGVACVVGDRVLAGSQSTASQNGIWTVASGGWSRAVDMNTWAKVVGATVWVAEGTVNADTGWLCTNNAGGTLGTTSITFVGIPTLTSTSVLTNKTLSNPVINTPTLTLANSPGPTPTTEGDIQWDSDDDAIVVGNASTQKYFRPNEWETISKASYAGVAQIDFTGLSAFRELMVEFEVSVVTDGDSVQMLVSTDNGSSFLNGATEYNNFTGTNNGATYTAANSATTVMQLDAGVGVGNAAGRGCRGEVKLLTFNQGAAVRWQGRAFFRTTAGAGRLVDISGDGTSTTAKNALRIKGSTGNINAFVHLRGLRG